MGNIIEKVTVDFKYDNRDVVIVKNAPNAKIALNYASDFLNEINDTTADYCVQSEHDEFNEDGSIEFRVKCYDK